MRRNSGQFPGLLFLFLCFSLLSSAAPPQTTYHIKVDQFGYYPGAKKVAVIADPQMGYNAAESFIPGTGANQYQVRRWSDDVAVFSGTLQIWNGGAIHAQSGDRGWWFDFSAVTTPGSYYVYDVANNVGSFRFEIGENVYDEVLKTALRTFFYQRINFAKHAPYTDGKWADGACFEGANQDRFATSRYAKGDMSTAKDLHGGWMDAGDLNKYTTFATSAVIQLMEAYRINPGVFRDNYNIPESGNGIPDILDEVKWELDFLKRMQDGTGTNGFLLKVGVDNSNEVTPPSTDTRSRYYLPECTAATLSGCAMFAVSGVTMKTVPALSSYGQDLIARAELAWARAKMTTNNFTTYQTACDDGDIKSGDADNDAATQLENAFVAAIYLYEATGKAEYKTFVESNIGSLEMYSTTWWGPYEMSLQLAMLRYAGLPNVSTTIASNIRSQKANMDYQNSINAYNARTDLYRAQMDDASFHWGHNQVRTSAGQINMDFVTFGINPTKHAQYKEVAEQYLHWMHGVNPLGMVMLSNMYAVGAEKSVNEIYHAWFAHGSIWDNALTSANGPAPGYVTGGPNKQFSLSIYGIRDQPHQKAYKDWNTAYPENSWEITEPSIYNQAAYIMLLSRLMTASTTPPPPADTEAPTTPMNLVASNVTENSVTLNWTASTDNTGVTGYDVYRETTLVQANVGNTTFLVSGLSCTTTYNFTVKAKDGAGNVSAASNEAVATTKSCPVITSSNIYGDAIGTGWSNTSTASSVNLNNTNPVKEGMRSIRVDYNGATALMFTKGTAVTTTASTQLRFWTYNSSKNGIRIYTESGAGAKSADVYLKAGSGKWVEVVVSMSQLGNPSSIKKVVIQNNSSKGTATMYFDQVQLTGVMEATPAVTSRMAPFEEPTATFMEWNVYPNPTRDYTLIRLNTPVATTATIDVVDNTGRVVVRQDTRLQQGMNQWRLSIPNIAPGIYYLRVKTEGASQAKALVIQ